MKNLTIGVIGGGQLGQMICMACQKLGMKVVVFSDQGNSPATFVTSEVIVADYLDKKALKKFADLVDVITFEFENIPFETLDFLASKKPVHPNPNILKTTQNRILEKNFLNSIGIKTTDFAEISSLQDLEKKLEKFKKAILKTATMGYDGKGQYVLSSKEEAKKIFPKVKNQKLILEKFCKFSKEISVIVARSKSGEIACYEPLQNIHKSGILDESIYPSNISKKLESDAKKIASKIALKLDLIGVLAVEFFVVGDELLVNELAPRPHNSGHFSIDACLSSQFDQLARAISDLKLGSTKFYFSGYMKNLIGDEIYDVEKYLKNPNAKLHNYGKSEAKAGRKMGHVNILKSPLKPMLKPLAKS